MKNVKKAFEKTLETLETDYLDMYSSIGLCRKKAIKTGRDWILRPGEEWRKFTGAAGVRAIGVSNFLPHHIENILQNCEIRPAVDQIEFHPGYTQEMTVQYCKEKIFRFRPGVP